MRASDSNDYPPMIPHLRSKVQSTCDVPRSEYAEIVQSFANAIVNFHCRPGPVSARVLLETALRISVAGFVSAILALLVCDSVW